MQTVSFSHKPVLFRETIESLILTELPAAGVIAKLFCRD